MLIEKTSKHVGTSTELTCFIPIKPGFIPSLDTRTYATRLRIVFKVLHGLRTLTREVRLHKPILDIVDAARTVQAFSWTIVNEQHLLLNVTFDRPWEPYIRIVWKDLGPLLDLFLCNCQGFVPSTGSFEAFAAFVRKHQVETGFFYPASSLTVDDHRYLVQLEKMQRDRSRGLDKRAATLLTKDFGALTEKDRDRAPADAISQWLGALDALFGLRNLYPEQSQDHIFLQRAAVALLRESRPNIPPELRSPAVEWLGEGAHEPEILQDDQRRDVVAESIQGGILKGYPKISHGCVMLARVERPQEARQFIGKIAQQVTKAADQDGRREHLNVAFTFNGLRELGVTESELQRFPKEFREGMEARAGFLGDVRHNHPENWSLPPWNVQFANGGTAPVAEFSGFGGKASVAALPPVRLSTVDIVFTMHVAQQKERTSEWNEDNPLYEVVRGFCTEALSQGVRVLSVQPLHRGHVPGQTETGNERPREHFGFVDGLSQPQPALKPLQAHHIELGELLVGFQNQRGDPPFGENDMTATPGRGSLIDSGSFLVIRKLQQNVQAFEAALAAAQKKSGLDRRQILTAMMGRSPEGKPLVPADAILPASGDRPENRFHFGNDPEGAVCPFHSHIRRANPRFGPEKSGRPSPPIPRLARRGMIYGPPVTKDPATADRGLVFMAYNASIAEQFEVIQRWMSGGNTPAENSSSGVYSGQPDPFLGLPDADGKRTYRFLHEGRVRRVDLGSTPFVTLQWGLYTFAPSITALEKIAGPTPVDVKRVEAVLESGRRAISTLKTRQHWEAVLEDVSANQSGLTAAIYAAIRADHGGVLRTTDSSSSGVDAPYGVLVTSEALVTEVLRNDDLFSVKEYQNRFGQSVGEGYLGLDDGPEYQELSRGPNKALELVSEEEAFEDAYKFSQQALHAGIETASTTAATIARLRAKGELTVSAASALVPLPLEPVVDHVIARLARKWFDIPDGTHIRVGGKPVAADGSLHCPFHLVAPSRYVFSSPFPREDVEKPGRDHGSRSLAAVREFVQRKREEERRTGRLALEGEVSTELFRQIEDDDLLARTLLGVTFGFAPTVYGNALQVLGLWLGDETLWRVQQRLLATTEATAYARAKCAVRVPLTLAMQTRPVPPVLHRTTTRPGQLGNLTLKEGERVVVAMAGATQDILARGDSNVMMVFGGDRQASDAPTHACPGARIAMGTLLGLLTAILETHPLVPTPALLTVRVRPRVVAKPGRRVTGSSEGQRDSDQPPHGATASPSR